MGGLVRIDGSTELQGFDLVTDICGRGSGNMRGMGWAVPAEMREFKIVNEQWNDWPGRVVLGIFI